MDKDVIIKSIEKAGWKKEEQKEYLVISFNLLGKNLALLHQEIGFSK